MEINFSDFGAVLKGEQVLLKTEKVNAKYNGSLWIKQSTGFQLQRWSTPKSGPLYPSPKSSNQSFDRSQVCYGKTRRLPE